MATLQLIRLRAGFYITRDAQLRIVRRKYLNKQVTRWMIERWSDDDRSYHHLHSTGTLAKAREYVTKYLNPYGEE